MDNTITLLNGPSPPNKHKSLLQTTHLYRRHVMFLSLAHLQERNVILRLATGNLERDIGLLITYFI
jgi:phosphatidylethanolamine-binding protein (PEBP) family uncharacterized protein